jgi:hypothetical protein
MLRDPVSRRGLECIFKTGQLPDVREAFLHLELTARHVGGGDNFRIG